MKISLKGLILFVSLSLTRGILAQMGGQPVGVHGQWEWTIGISGNYINQLVAKDKMESRRILIKSSWGLLSFLDINATLGSVDLKIKPPGNVLTPFRDKKSFAYGAGFSSTLKQGRPDSPLGLWIGGQVIRFISDGSFLIPFGNVTLQSVMKYDWREFQGYGGIYYLIKKFKIYCGGVGWTVQRIDKLKQYDFSSGVYIGKKESEFQDHLWTGGLVGIEMLLPKNYSISFEVLAFNQENYQIRFGICQTGSPK